MSDVSPRLLLRESPKTGRRTALDRIGIALAGICAVHCTAALALVSGLGLGGHLLLSHDIHEIGLVAAMAVAAFAFGWGFLRHRQFEPFLIAALGLGTMGAALGTGHGEQEAFLTVIGVALVSLGHVQNMRAARGWAT